MTSRTTALTAALAAGLITGSAARAGTFSTFPITDDASTGISSSKTYTHAFDLHRGGADPHGGNDALPLTINGVPFASGETTGTDAVHGGSYTTTNLGNTFDNLNTTQTGGIGDLLDDFIYQSANGSTVTLNGLTPSTSYRAVFYVPTEFGGASQTITANDASPGSLTTDRGGGKGIAYDYTTGPASTSITFTFSADNGNDGFHQYGFTNEVVPEPASAGLCGVAALGLLGRRRRRA